MSQPLFRGGQRVDVFTYLPNAASAAVSWSIEKKQWRIGTIKKVTGDNKPYNYRIKIDGFGSQHDVTKFGERDIKKLNTHTIRHNYLYNPCPDICYMNKFKRCPKCGRKCCISCNICKLGAHSYCGECIDNVQFNQIHSTIAPILQRKYDIIHSKIINLITALSMGYEYKCCTSIDSKKCENYILFNNAFDFKYDRDINYDKTYKYLMNKKYLKSHYDQDTKLLSYTTIISMHGEIMRIFCPDCRREMDTACSSIGYPECEIKHQSSDTCYNHPLCHICHEFAHETKSESDQSYSRWPMHDENPGPLKCEFCRKWFCKNCGLKDKLICKICDNNNEYKRYRNAVFKSNIGKMLGKDLSYLIARFCTGYAALCCTEDCDNVIVINSKTEWNTQRNSEDRPFYKYKLAEKYLSYIIDNIKYNHARIYKTYSLFGEQGRIFCADCTENRLQKCKIAYSVSPWNGWECDHKDTDEYCKSHNECGAGGKEEVKGLNGKLYPVFKCKFQKMMRDVTNFQQRSSGRRNYEDPNFASSGAIEKLVCAECNHKRKYHEYNYPTHYWDGYTSYGGYWYDCYDWYDDYDAEIAEDLCIKNYYVSKDERRFGNIYGDRRITRKSNKETKASNFKKHKKRKSFVKIKNDKRFSRKMNKKFKKRYLLSLQF